MVLRIQTSIEELSRILSRIQEQLAWESLALAETRQGLPPSFQVQTSAREQARREIPILGGKFKSLALDIHEALQHAPEKGRQQASKLQELEHTFHSLRLTEKFISL
jgi:hypothetical protein